MRQATRLHKRVLLTVIVLFAAGLILRDQLNHALARAVEQGDLARVGRILRLHICSLSVSDSYKAIRLTTAHGDAGVLELLLRQVGAKPDPAHLSNDLTSAIENKHLGCVSLLIAHGADPNGVVGSDSASQLSIATNAHFAQAITVLRAHGAHFTLFEAARFGDLDELKARLDNGVNLEQRNEKAYDGGTSLLALAAESGSAECVRLLLSRGAKVNAYGGRSFFWGDDSIYETPLMFAAHSGKVAAMSALLDAGADVNAVARLNKPSSAGSRGAHHNLLHSGITALMLAAYNGNVETVRCLLKRGANPNARTVDGTTALILDLSYMPPAAVCPPPVDQSEASGGTGGAGGEPSSLNSNAIPTHNPDNKAEGAYVQYTPLEPGRSRGEHADVARMLILAGADIHAGSAHVGTLLQIACRNGYSEVVDLLISRGADVNRVTRSGYSPLMCALNFEAGRVPNAAELISERVRLTQTLLAHGANINYRASDGMSALLIAAQRNEPAAVRALLLHGADTRAISKSGGTFRDFAIGSEGGDAASERAEMVSILHGLNIRLSLMEAAKCGNVEEIKWNLDRGADPNTRWSPPGQIPPKAKTKLTGHLAGRPVFIPLRHSVAGLGSSPKTDFVLHGSAGGEPSSIKSQVDSSNMPAPASVYSIAREVPVLYEAAASNNPAAALLLLDRGAKTEAANSLGRTALMAAAENNRAATIRLLVSHRANIEARDRRSWTALMIASNSGRDDAVKALVESGCKVDALDNNGWTALMRAVSMNKSAIANYLLDHGADIHLKNRPGLTPLAMATNSNIVSLLKRRGATE